MEFMQYRAYYTHLGEQIELCKFWINENGDIDSDNLPSNGEVARLLQAIRLHDIHTEFTGRIENE